MSILRNPHSIFPRLARRTHRDHKIPESPPPLGAVGLRATAPSRSLVLRFDPAAEARSKPRDSSCRARDAPRPHFPAHLSPSPSLRCYHRQVRRDLERPSRAPPPARRARAAAFSARRRRVVGRCRRQALSCFGRTAASGARLAGRDARTASRAPRRSVSTCLHGRLPSARTRGDASCAVAGPVHRTRPIEILAAFQGRATDEISSFAPPRVARSRRRARASRARAARVRVPRAHPARSSRPSPRAARNGAAPAPLPPGRDADAPVPPSTRRRCVVTRASDATLFRIFLRPLLENAPPRVPPG